MKKFLLSFGLTISGLCAYADQAAYLTKVQADKYVSYFKTNGLRQVVLFCGCCADYNSSEPVRVVTIQNIFSRYTGYEKYYEIVLEGTDREGNSVSETIDLPYVWVRSGGNAVSLCKKVPMPGVSCDPCSGEFPWP